MILDLGKYHKHKALHQLFRRRIVLRRACECFHGSFIFHCLFVIILTFQWSLLHLVLNITTDRSLIFNPSNHRSNQTLFTFLIAVTHSVDYLPHPFQIWPSGFTYPRTCESYKHVFPCIIVVCTSKKYILHFLYCRFSSKASITGAFGRASPLLNSEHRTMPP